LPTSKIHKVKVLLKAPERISKLRINLSWLNEECHVCGKSTGILDSDGHELVICPNCLVVYHRECVKKLYQINKPYCLACGSKIPLEDIKVRS